MSHRKDIELIVAEGVTYVSVVGSVRQNLKINVHRQSKVLLEPDSREVDDTTNFSVCISHRTFLFNKAFVNPDVKSGCCRPGQVSLPSCTTGLGRLRRWWCICFSSVGSTRNVSPFSSRKKLLTRHGMSLLWIWTVALPFLQPSTSTSASMSPFKDP